MSASFLYGTITPATGWNFTNNLLRFTTVGTYTFVPNSTIDISYIVVGGGGGGSINDGGGGGETRVGSMSLISGISYIVSVGVGGDGSYSLGNNGEDSTFSTVIAKGGDGAGNFSETGDLMGSIGLGGTGGTGGTGYDGGNGGGQASVGSNGYSNLYGGGGGGGGSGQFIDTGGNGGAGGGGGGGGANNFFGNSLGGNGGDGVNAGGDSSGAGVGGHGGIPGSNGNSNGSGGEGGSGSGGFIGGGGGGGGGGGANSGGGGGGGGYGNGGYGHGGGGGSGVVILTFESSSVIHSNICFPKGTPIVTDQGLIEIQKINPEKNTIRGKQIVTITETVTPDNYLVCFEKDSLGPNIPSQKTVMTKNHCIFYKGVMVKAEEFLNKFENIKKVKYNGEPLYNVLLKTHDKMMVNNLITETLSPKNRVARLYYCLNLVKPEEKEILIQEFNNYSLNKKQSSVTISSKK